MHQSFAKGNSELFGSQFRHFSSNAMLPEFRDHLHQKQLWKGEGMDRKKKLFHILFQPETMPISGRMSQPFCWLIVAQLSLSLKIIRRPVCRNQKQLQKILTGFDLFQFKAIKRENINSFEYRSSLTSNSVRNTTRGSPYTCLFIYFFNKNRARAGRGG